MEFSELIRVVSIAFHTLLLDTPEVSPWAKYLLWTVRLITLSLLFRTYLAPFILARISDRVRVRSVSFRSIRGLYFRKGAQTWRVERIRFSYRWSSPEGSSRVFIKVQGLSLEINQDELPIFYPKPSRSKRGLTISDFAPSPIARRSRLLILKLCTWLEPTFRPIFRALVVGSLRHIIRHVPAIMQAINFDLDIAVLTFSALPGTRIVFEDATFHIALAFTQLESVASDKNEGFPPKQRLLKSFSVGAWRDRLSNSFVRSWDRAWGKTEGSASISLRIKSIRGSTKGKESSLASDDLFLALHDALALDASVDFSPRQGRLESHSLEATCAVGELLVVVDAVMRLMQKARRSTRTPTTVDVPATNSSSLLTPNSLFMSSPTSAGTASMLSPISTNSPFFDVLSASMRPMRRLRGPLPKLEDKMNYTWLSILKSANILISTMKLSVYPSHSSQSHDVYEAIIKNVAISAGLSHASEGSLHRAWLGRQPKIDHLDADVYAGKFSMDQATVETHTISALDKIPLLTLGGVDVEALLSQWPSSWLATSPFLSEDPNAPLLVLRARISRVEATDDAEHFKNLFIESVDAEDSNFASPLLPSVLYPVPRIALEVECGNISARIKGRSEGRESHTICLHTDGFILSLTSQFLFVSAMGSHHAPRQDYIDHLPVEMKFTGLLVVQSIFVRVASPPQGSRGSARSSAVDSCYVEDPALLSIETIEITAEGSTLGVIRDDYTDAVSLDVSSTVVDLHCSTEAVSVELWHIAVISAIREVLALGSNQATMRIATNHSRMLEKLPYGCIATFSIARFVMLVTGPDINPKDDMDLSRGFAFRTGTNMQYCSLRSEHTRFFRHISARSEIRHKLYLFEQRNVPAVAAARSSPVTHNISAFLRIMLWDSSIRSAVATQYTPDDPFFVERDDPNLRASEYVRMRSAAVDISLSGKRTLSGNTAHDSCDIVINIPYVRCEFKLIHAYGLLLALRVLQSLAPIRINPGGSHTLDRGILYRLQLIITASQIFWIFPKQRLISRIESLNAHGVLGGSVDLRCDTFLFFAFVPAQRVIEESNADSRWEEMARLQHLSASIQPKIGNLSVTVDSHSASFRIPFGFVLANLILDIGVTLKCVRHLSRAVTAGCLMPMSSPEPEAAKLVPILAIHLRCLSIEAADDPFESRLGLIWRAGLEASNARLEREDAFKAKVASILATDSPLSSQQAAPDLDWSYHFDSNHSVSIEEAHQRLCQLHAIDWKLRYRLAREDLFERPEDQTIGHIRGKATRKNDTGMQDLPDITPRSLVPPLFRAVVNNLSLKAAPPSFDLGGMGHFLSKQGGLPLDTQFSLLIPMHLNISLSSMRVALRDYPLPLLDVPAIASSSATALDFDADLVIAEEMGSSQSVDWLACTVIEQTDDLHGSSLAILVPKTIMPVKTYANPVIRVTTSGSTSFSWGVSYAPATQDLMRVLETVSSSPRDLSPGLGFWDKIRLILHWTAEVHFVGPVRLHMKGSRDPYNVFDEGAGFLLSWQGHPRLVVGHQNQDHELIQVISDSMLIAIPNLEKYDRSARVANRNHGDTNFPEFQKVCAKFGGGVCFGVGFALERSCGRECLSCTGDSFDRVCRFFNFSPHYEVRLKAQDEIPEIKTPGDSYNGFRSDFIHMSVSLSSSMHKKRQPAGHGTANSLHLTPKAFAHFWSWWALFDSVLSLPIRQGTYYPWKTPSPKLARHLATLKYRICVYQLNILHAYIDDSRETWMDGVTPFVGVKAMIEEFQADMHQRDQETIVPGAKPDTVKVTHHKGFYDAEVVLKGIDLRAMLATFAEPFKKSAAITSPQCSSYRKRYNLPFSDSFSPWIDLDDFVEIDWASPAKPSVHFLPVMSCPRITYLKRNTSRTQVETSKFGEEETHVCLLGKEESVPQVQIRLASLRVADLRKSYDGSNHGDQSQLELSKMIALLEEYIEQLSVADQASENADVKHAQSYYMPSDTVSTHEWADFNNVFQFHCPQITMNTAIRDVLMQYYYCSRARRGLEYHMATRAVKFIRDQAAAALKTHEKSDPGDFKGTASSAQAAANALRKILGGDSATKVSAEASESNQPPGVVDPMLGWSDGVVLQKSLFCLLLKPQIILRSEESVCVLAAVQAKMQSFAIVDESNLEDPVSGQVMSRNYTSLTGLQSFSPTELGLRKEDCVPLEVLIDFRCESSNFDRLVPQTDATFHYDKFNRLRLRNNVTSVVRRSREHSAQSNNNHLQTQTDLIQVHVPNFTVSANAEHFQAISNIVTRLVLFSDVAHKTRSEKLETMLFTYDFADLGSAANVVADLQRKLRGAQESERKSKKQINSAGLHDEDLLKLKAHIFLLAEELSLLFDAIKLAQDRANDQNDQKSALLLQTSSSEISWRMLDEQKELLAKLAVRDIDYSWLSRQDSSTVNHLAIGNLQAFDGSPDALWAEILCKHDQPANHPLLKKGLFISSNWTVLAPVGGIAIYEDFILSLHPMRLQVDAKVGRKILEYLWPARKDRNHAVELAQSKAVDDGKTLDFVLTPASPSRSRSSLDSPRALPNSNSRIQKDSSALAPPILRKLGTSRSFSDLRTKSSEFSQKAQRITASYPRKSFSHALEAGEGVADGLSANAAAKSWKLGDAAEMKTRSSQKTFVLVRISSLDLLVSLVKEDSFEFRDARIRTRALEYRNQTWSFEELVNQFIPSDMSWKGWVKVALHQPLVPVLPVARELISKTKWIASKGGNHSEMPNSSSSKLTSSGRNRSPSPHRRQRKSSSKRLAPATPSTELNSTQANFAEDNNQTPRPAQGRTRLLSLFSRSGTPQLGTSSEGGQSSSTFASGSQRRSADDNRVGRNERFGRQGPK